MRYLLASIFLFSGIISICSCGAGNMKNVNTIGMNKRTVTFKPHEANNLSGAEEAIASRILINENTYLPRYVEVNYESVNSLFDSLYSNLNYWDKSRFISSSKRQYRLYANAAGTDQLLYLDIHISYDTTMTAEESKRLWDHLWENNNSNTKELVGAKEAHYYTVTSKISKIKYNLKYINGQTGKTIWSMKYHWSPGLFGSKNQDPVQQIIKKFEKKFPYKLAST